jgi:LytS/YehU family sensor histidine kinase
MKQKKLLRELYRANLERNTKQLCELRQKELAHILEKRKQGKHRFSPKWCVTDER